MGLYTFYGVVVSLMSEQTIENFELVHVTSPRRVIVILVLSNAIIDN